MAEALFTTLLSGLFLLVGTLGGVALGWELNRRTTQRQEREREAQIRHGVRMLLRLESKQNIDALSDFWKRVASSYIRLPGIGALASVSYGMDEEEFGRSQMQANEPMPTWRKLMWESQAGLVASALTPAEVDHMYMLYSDLETLTARQTELRKLFDTPDGKKLSEEFGNWMQHKFQGKPTPGTSQSEVQLGQALREFNEKTRTLWNDSKVICERPAYKVANLIEEDAPPG